MIEASNNIAAHLSDNGQTIKAIHEALGMEDVCSIQ